MPRSPGARLGHAMAYVDHAGALLLFGGFQQDGQPLDDTWVWNSDAWRQVPGPGPSPRRWPAMAYDSRRRRLILHGGRDGLGSAGRPLDDTWQWDDTGWRLIARRGPGARDHHRLVYDSRRDRLVLFGGWDGEQTRADVWELDDETWRAIDAAGPAPRAAHGMAYDAGRGHAVVFGGTTGVDFLDDTWIWTGRAWTAVPAPGPAARSFHGMTFDRLRRLVVLAGGRRGPDLYDDTWTFDGAAWTQSAEAAFPARYVYELAFDAARRESVFHGGGFMRDGRWTLFDETWAFTAEGWSRRR